MNEERPDILQGSLDLLILCTLRVGAMHGWSISLHIQQVSHDVLYVQQGSQETTPEDLPFSLSEPNLLDSERTSRRLEGIAAWIFSHRCLRSR